MENVLKQIGVFLGEQFSRVLGEFTGHTENHEIHKSSAEIRSEITEEDVPDSIARDTEVNMKIQTHNASGEAHQDIRKAITDIKNVECSEYAVHLGTEGDSYTKAQLDSKINKHIKGVSYDQGSAKFTFTFEDGTVAEVDTPVENTVKDARYDAAAGEFVLVLVSGAEIRIAAAGMVKTYSGAATATATVAVSAEGVISADVKAGDTKDNITTFAEAVERENIESGENHSILLGKIRKWFSSLGGLAFRDSVESLNVIYENGDSAVYQGTEALTILVPGSGGRRIVLKGLHMNKHGFYQIDLGDKMLFTIDVVGIPVTEDSRAFLRRVVFSNGEWIPTNNSAYPYPFVKEKGSATYSDDGFWQWYIEYTDPVTFENQVLYGDIFRVQITSGRRFFVATDPMSFYRGYMTTTEDWCSCCFEAVGFSEEATVKLQMRSMDGAWADHYDVEFLVLDGARYVRVDSLNAGEYQVVATEPDGTDYSSGEFRVTESVSPGVYQAKLDNLVNNANLIYATKEEISILQDNGAIVIPYDYTKIRTERIAEAQAAWALYPKSYVGKPFYILFKFFDNAGNRKLTELVSCAQPIVYDDDNENEREAEAILTSPILTQDEIVAGVTEKKARKLRIYWSGTNIAMADTAFSKLVPIKSFNLYFLPEGKFPWDWSEYCTANQGVEISGELTRYSNENIVACDKWDNLYTFMRNDKVNENRIPPIYLRTITSDTTELLKPTMIVPKCSVTGGGTTNIFFGFILRTCSIEVVNGVRCFVEETLNIPDFTGYGSAYTYKFIVTPCNPKVEVVTEYPTDLSGVADGTIFIKSPVA